MCKKLYETPTYRAYVGIKAMLDRLGKYMEVTPIEHGRDGNMNSMINAAAKFEQIRQSYKGAFTDMNKVRVFALAHVLAQVDRTFCKDGKNLFSKVSMLFARNTLNMMMLMRDEYILDHGEPKEGIKHTIPALNVIEKYLAGKKSMINLPYGRSI